MLACMDGSPHSVITHIILRRVVTFLTVETRKGAHTKWPQKKVDPYAHVVEEGYGKMHLIMTMTSASYVDGDR